MDLILYEHPGVRYQSILQLSLFILMSNRSEQILDTLGCNVKHIVEIISPFQVLSKDDQEDFAKVKTKMINKLHEYGKAWQ